MTALVVIEVAITGLVSLAFAIMYALRSNWQSSAIGRHLMIFSIITAMECFALVLLGVGVKIPMWIFAVMYGIVALVGIQRLYLLILAQNRG